MFLARDFRAQARENLRGKWTNTFLLVLFCTIIAFGFSLAGSIYLSTTGVSFNAADPQSVTNYYSSAEYLISIGITIIGGVLSIFFYISEITLYLQISYNKNPSASSFFRSLKRAGESAWIMIVIGVRVFLWTLLFIIPGIRKAYSYSMAVYIKIENPQMTTNEAIAQSCKIMEGNRWRLFCLQFSFIGWAFLMGLATTILEGLAGSIVSAISISILGIFLTIYMGVSGAMFYRSLKPEEPIENSFDETAPEIEITD